VVTARLRLRDISIQPKPEHEPHLRSNCTLPWPVPVKIMVGLPLLHRCPRHLLHPYTRHSFGPLVAVASVRRMNTSTSARRVRVGEESAAGIIPRTTILHDVTKHVWPSMISLPCPVTIILLLTKLTIVIQTEDTMPSLHHL
jgi:hypothetical protein